MCAHVNAHAKEAEAGEWAGSSAVEGHLGRHSDEQSGEDIAQRRQQTDPLPGEPSPAVLQQQLEM